MSSSPVHSRLRLHDDLIVRDHKIAVPNGAVLARDWVPYDAAGEPLVLLHDSLGCIDVWRDFPAMLARAANRRIIAYDRLGFGRSDARCDDLTSSFVREESEIFLPYVLRSLRLDRFIPLGHSVGGGMAMHCGDTLRDSCAAIITIAAQMFADSKTPDSMFDIEGGLGVLFSYASRALRELPDYGLFLEGPTESSSRQTKPVPVISLLAWLHSTGVCCRLTVRPVLTRPAMVRHCLHSSMAARVALAAAKSWEESEQCYITCRGPRFKRPLAC